MISFKELLKEKQYQISVYKKDEKFVDINTYHPEVYRIQISVDTDIDEFASKSANFPNLQELIIDGNFMSFPTGVFKFNKLQILEISFCAADICGARNVITLSDDFFELRNLKVIRFSGASCLFYIPEKIAKLEQLMCFENESNFGGPIILPVSLAYLPKLQYLGLNYREGLHHNRFFYFEKNIPFKEDEDFIKWTHLKHCKDYFFYYYSYNCLDTNYNLKTIDKKINHRYPN